MKIKNLLQAGYLRLKNVGIESFALDIRILLKFILGVSEEFLLLNQDLALSNNQIEDFNRLVQRREKLEPISYIIGFKEFYGRDFVVTKDVLIPRPDSEILIESVLVDYKKLENLRILELGTGSGCLIITLLLELQKASAIAVDINKAALAVAKQNAENLEVDNINFIESDWFSALRVAEKFDIIIANPPYIALDSTRISKETNLYEPKVALFASGNGLSCYKEIALKARDFLAYDGSIFVEIGYDQEESVADVFLAEGYILVSKARDLGGYVRCMSFKYK